jgi:hypothetical protein
MNPEKVSEAYHRFGKVTSDFWADCGVSQKKFWGAGVDDIPTTGGVRLLARLRA